MKSIKYQSQFLIHPNLKTTLIYIKTFLMFYFFSINIYAQNTGKVKFTIVPSTSYIKVNQELIKISEKKELELTSGKHIIKIWAPKMAVFIDTIEIKSGETLSYRKGLRTLSSEYKEHKQELKKYQFKRVRRYASGLAIAGAGTLGYLLLNEQKKTVNDYRDAALEARTIYENSVADLDQLKASYQKNLDRFEKEKKQYNNSLIIGVSGLR